jgi:hypothetical protein
MEEGERVASCPFRMHKWKPSVSLNRGISAVLPFRVGYYPLPTEERSPCPPMGSHVASRLLSMPSFYVSLPSCPVGHESPLRKVPAGRYLMRGFLLHR